MYIETRLHRNNKNMCLDKTFGIEDYSPPLILTPVGEHVAWHNKYPCPCTTSSLSSRFSTVRQKNPFHELCDDPGQGRGKGDGV